MIDVPASSLHYRPLGRTGLVVSELGVGCARLGGIFQNQSHNEAISLLHEALAAGINFFDTSDLYCQGESEQLLGRAFEGMRDRVVIATKVGYCLPSRRRLIAGLKPVVRPLLRVARLRRAHMPAAMHGALRQDFSPAHLQAALEGSLRRLRTDYVDLYQLHSPPLEVIARGDFIDALERMKQAGKIRAYGVSCETTADAALCLRYPQLAALQLRVSLLDQSILPQVLPAARAAGVGVIARECFGGGVLARPPEPGNEGVQTWSTLAMQDGLSLAEMALSFVLDLEGVSVALVGVRTAGQLRDALAAIAAPGGRPSGRDSGGRA